MNETATILRLLKKGSSTRLLSIPTSGASPAVSGAERLWESNATTRSGRKADARPTLRRAVTCGSTLLVG